MHTELDGPPAYPLPVMAKGMLRMDSRTGEMRKLGDLSFVFFSSAARNRFSLRMSHEITLDCLLRIAV